MAEIHVEAKKKTTPLWFWIVLFLIVLGAIAAYVAFRDDDTLNRNTPQPTSSHQIEESRLIYTV
jgi:hypothetical protein